LRSLKELRSRGAAAWERSREVLKAPRVQIDMYGDDEAWIAYGAFTRRHPRFRVTQAKRWGVALVRLPDTFDGYVGGGSNKLLRQKRRLAEKAGFRYEEVDSAARVDEVLAVNLSTPERQGRAMSAGYTDRARVEKTLARYPRIHAILDREGVLRAYAVTPLVGDLFFFTMILGHADDMEHGTMYLLVSEVIRSFIETPPGGRRPTWAMYDTFWGAAPGLAYFKRRVGFDPYTVEWRWRGERPGGAA
jgi:hypothetical protein